MDEQQPPQIQNQSTVQGQIAVNHGSITMHFGSSPTPPMPPQHLWNIPYLRNDYFTGREEILAELYAHFKVNKANHATALSQRHAMSGLGGIGKTQIAVEYAHRYQQDYQAVLWARAESHEALTSSFVEIARLLDLPQKDEQDQTVIVQAVKRWLQGNHGWLMILDNADEPKIVCEFLPTKFDGHILFTTRAQALGRLAQRIEVDTFTSELGALFLLRRATLIAADGALDDAIQSDREGAMQISEELGGLPLALDQAGAYIEETSCSLADYLGLYRTHRAEVLKERGGLVDDHPEPVATTWSLSFQRVEEKNPAAAYLLRLCAFLHPDAIPEEIITAGAEYLGPQLQAAARNPMILNKAIATLGAYSLILRDATEKTLSIHRLVQAVLQDAMSTEEKKLWAERTVCAINAVFPKVEFTTWSRCEQCIAHVQACIAHIKDINMVPCEAVGLLDRAGEYLTERTRYPEAEQLLLKAREFHTQQLESDHPDAAVSLHNLATLYVYQNKLEEAENLYRRALTIRERQLGSNHLDTAISFDSLGLLYENQERYADAEQYYQQALTIRKGLVNASHPIVAESLCSIARLRINQQKHEEAKRLLQRALQIYKQQLITSDPKIAVCLNSLGTLYKELHEYSEAEQHFLNALDINEQQLGSLHINVAANLNNLALLYYDQGRYDKAEQYFRRVLDLNEQMGESLHPRLTGSVIAALTLLYCRQQRYAEAEQLYQRDIKSKEHYLGPEHLSVANTIHNLATLYHEQEKYTEAELLYQRALAIREKQPDTNPLEIATDLYLLAVVYTKMGRCSEAKPLYQQALTIRQEKLGLEHPLTKVVDFALNTIYPSTI